MRYEGIINNHPELLHIRQSCDGPTLPISDSPEVDPIPATLATELVHVSRSRVYEKLAPLLLAAGLLLSACNGSGKPESVVNVTEVPVLAPDSGITEIQEQTTELIETISPVDAEYVFSTLMNSTSTETAGDVDVAGVIRDLYPEYAGMPATAFRHESSGKKFLVVNMTGVEVNVQGMLRFMEIYEDYVAENPTLSFGGKQLYLYNGSKEVYGVYVMPDTIPLPTSIGVPQGMEVTAYTLGGDIGNASFLRLGPSVFDGTFSNDPLLDLALSFAIEACQNDVNVRTDNPEDDYTWQEIFCNSMGYGMIAASQGLEYDKYAGWIKEQTFLHPNGAVISLIPIDGELYNNFANSVDGSIFTIPALP